MRESRTYGSVRGALSNERPYRDRFARNDGEEVREAPRLCAPHMRLKYGSRACRPRALLP
jgi:hypothetical protein